MFLRILFEIGGPLALDVVAPLLVLELQLPVEAIRHYPEVDEDCWKINDSYNFSNVVSIKP